MTPAAGWWTTRFLYIFEVWQLPLIILVVALIIFWLAYRRRQM
jgi:cytochrome c-type biogenesis protein CcmH/NrfF